MLKELFAKIKEKDKNRIVLIGILISLIMAAGLISNIEIMNSKTKEEVGNIIAESSIQVATQLEQYIRESFRQLQSAETLLEGYDSLSGEDAHTVLTALKKSGAFAHVAIKNADNSAFLDSGETTRNVNWRGKTRYSADGVLGAVGRVGKFLDEGMPGIQLSIPIKKDGKNTGAYLYGIIGTDELSKKMKSASFGGSGSIIVLETSTGALTADTWHTHPQMLSANYYKELEGYECVDTDKAVFVKSITSGNKILATVKSNATGQKMYYYSMPTNISDWTMILMVQESVALSSISKENTTVAVMIIMVIALLIIFLLYLSYVFNKSMLAEKTNGLVMKFALHKTNTRIMEYNRVTGNVINIKTFGVDQGENQKNSSLEETWYTAGFDAEALEQFLEACIKAKPGKDEEFKIKRESDGKTEYYRVAVVQSENSNIAIGIFNDVTDEEEAIRRAKDADAFRENMLPESSAAWKIDVDKDKWCIISNFGQPVLDVLKSAINTWQNFEDSLLGEMKSIIYKEDFDKYYDILCIKSLKKMFANGDDNTSCEYRVNDHGIYKWKQVRLKLYIDPESGDKVADAYILDIDKKKRAAIKAAEERAFYRQNKMLSDVANEAYEYQTIVNLDNMYYEHKTLKNGIADEMPIPESGNYRIEFEKFLEGEIAGEQRQAVSDCISPDALIKYSNEHRESNFSTTYRLERTKMHLYISCHVFFTENEGTPYAVIMNKDVTEEVVSKQRLEEALLSAQAANRAKTTFLSSMSHEIRTPMNAIIGMSELALGGDLSDNVREYIEDIHTAGQNLLSMINGILDFSKIESGAVEIANEPYDLASVIYDISTLIHFRVEGKPIKVEYDVNSDIPSKYFGDETKIRQIILNLMNNAVKYTEHGNVTLRVSGAEKDGCEVLSFSVEDTGIGIHEEELSKIFGNFYRADQKKNYGIEGTGLGLSICKRLADAMGATLTAQSEYGRGSTFTFTISQQIADDTPISSSRHKRGRRRSSDTARFIAPDAKILIVDDNSMNLKVAAGLLAKYKIVPELAESGRQCIGRIADGERFDLILLDHMMPGMDGIETLSELKKIEGFDSPVIALTANSVLGAKNMYIKAGFNDYLSKPIEAGGLHELLREYLGEKISEVSGDTEKTLWLSPELSEYLTENRVDTDSAASYMGDNAEQYMAMLSLFAKEADEKKKRMEDFLASGKLHEYEIVVHALKSSAKTLGFNALSGIALGHERAATKNDADYIALHKEALFGEWEHCVETCKEVQKRTGGTKAKADLVEMSAEDIEKRLSIAYSSVESLHIEAAAEVLAQLCGARLDKKTRECAQKALTAIENFDYDTALVCLKKESKK